VRNRFQRELTQPSYFTHENQEKCPNLHPIAIQPTTPAPRHLPSAKSVSAQVTLRTSAKPLDRTSHARRARRSSKIRVPSPNQRPTESHRSTSQRSLKTRAELRIGSWRPRRSRGSRKRQIERRNGRNGHQARLSPLPPSQNRRPTLVLNPSRRARARTPIVHAHAQENGMRSVGGHEGVASHANLLVTVIAVAVQAVDALIICTRLHCHIHLSFLGFPACCMRSSHSAPHTRSPFVEAGLG